MGKNMPYMVLDITKKPGDPSAVKTGDMLVAENAKLREVAETALKTIRGVINSTISPRSNTVFDCRDKLSAALAAPPRKSSPPAAGKRAKGGPGGQ